MRPSTSAALRRAALQPRTCAVQPAWTTAATAIGCTSQRPTPRHRQRRGLATVTSAAEPENVKNIAVIGGGITGLSTAHYLAKYAGPGTTVTLYEASDRLGGWLRTEHVEFEHEGQTATVRFERGPRTLRSFAKDIWKMDDIVLFDLLRDLQLKPIFKKGGNRFVAFGDKVVPISLKSILFHPKLRGIWPGAVKAWWNKRRSRLGGYEKVASTTASAMEDVSVGEYVRKYSVNNRALDTVVSAVLNGVWAGNPDRMSMRSVQPASFWSTWFKQDIDKVIMPAHEAQLLEMGLGDEGIQKMITASVSGQLVMFKDGMSALPKAIEDRLTQDPAVQVKTGTPVEKIEYDASADKVMVTAGGEPKAYDKVISTIFSRDLASLANSLPSLASAEAATITTVNLWFPEPNLNAPYRGIGYLLPRNDGGFHDSHGLLGGFFDSDALDRISTEPPGTKLFYLFRGAIPEDEATELAREVASKHLGIDPQRPAIHLHRINKDCIPQHNVGHTATMTRAAAEVAQSFGGRLAVAGPSYTALGVVGSIRAGHDVAAQVSGLPNAHIGPTGLGQFVDDGPPKLVQVSRQKLRDLGRAVPLKVPKWMYKIT